MRPTALTALPVLLLLAAFGFAARPADAKLEGDQWKQAQADYARLFAGPGGIDEKHTLVRTLASDGEARSWKLLLDALVKEAGWWVAAQTTVNEQVAKIGTVLSKPSAQRFPEDQANLQTWEEELPRFEAEARTEREILEDLIQVIAAGPEALRKNILARGKTDPEWTVRAAAARIAGLNAQDAESQAFLQRCLTQDKDPRVRLSALEALLTAEKGWEEHVLGRLADADWGVQMFAVRVAGEKKLTRAVPHLINALDKANPRIQQEIGSVLQALTGQNFDPYADVWAKWWAEHREEFEAGAEVKTGGKPKEQFPDVTVYGLKVKSDRVVFIIDISGSMKHEAKNPGGEKPKPPAGPITPNEQAGPPPPPPPEEILSGPKIDIAKDELRKAIKKLPKNAKFSVIAFNHAVLPWKDTLVDASEANKEEALKWVRQLQASGSTYVDGALRQAFQMAGTAAVDDKYRDLALDSILLICDGAPTAGVQGEGESKLMDPQIILDHVREWNPHRRVVIHTICVDMIDGVKFMRDLAAQNGGISIDR